MQKEDSNVDNTQMKQGDNQDGITVTTDDTKPKSAFLITLNSHLNYHRE